jgi:integrase
MAGLPNAQSYTTNPISNSPNSELNVLASLEVNGASQITLKDSAKRFRQLKKLADLRQPEEVKQAIALLEVSNGTKANLCNLYQKYVDYYNLEWIKPKYKHQRKLVKIPTREKIEMLIAHAGRILATKLQISYETGLRPVEVISLTPQEIDFDHRLILPRTAKNGAPRALKFSLKLEAMLREYIQRENIQPTERLFKTTARNYSQMFRISRNALAKKLQDPTIKSIRLYDFRHFFATNLYSKTRDLLLVKTQLGHKEINNTLFYTQLLNFEEDEYIVKGAETKEQAMKLIENGYEYVTEMDGTKIFRKRK